MTAKELDLARAQNAMLELTAERLHRLERAVAELAEELHGVSGASQLAARGKPALASVLEAFRANTLGSDDEVRAWRARHDAQRDADEARRREIESAPSIREGWSKTDRENWHGYQAEKRRREAGQEES